MTLPLARIVCPPPLRRSLLLQRACVHTFFLLAAPSYCTHCCTSFVLLQLPAIQLCSVFVRFLGTTRLTLPSPPCRHARSFLSAFARSNYTRALSSFTEAHLLVLVFRVAVSCSNYPLLPLPPEESYLHVLVPRVRVPVSSLVSFLLFSSRVRPRSSGGSRLETLSVLYWLSLCSLSLSPAGSRFSHTGGH